MKKTGELLRKERESRGLTLHEIGLSLKINSKILKAIEEGNSSQLPAKTFLRGFVQSYASYLKLNVEDVLRIFTEEMGSTRPQPIIKEDAAKISSATSEPAPPATPLRPDGGPKSEKPQKASINFEDTSATRGIVFALIAVLLAGLITLTVKVIDKYQREAQVASVEVKPIAEEEAAPIPATAANQVSKAAAPDVAAAPTTIPSLPVAVTASTPTTNPPEKNQSPPSTTLAPTAALVVAPTPAPAPTTPAPKTTSPALEPKKEEPKKSEPKARSLELIVEALDSVEIEYSSSDGKADKITLGPEQVHTFKSKAGLKLNISNGGAVNVILNGKDKGVPGDLGKPIILNY